MSTKKHRKAFTLIEILLVMLITSILVMGVNAAFRQARMLYTRIENQRPVYRETSLFVDTMRDELTCLYMPKFDKNQPPPFRLSKLPDGSVILSFLTLNPAYKNSATSSFPARVIYEFNTDSDSGRKALSRTEQLFSAEKPIAKERHDIIMQGFSDFAIQAADPNVATLANSWKDNLQSRQIPPKAVKILLKWPRNEQTDFEFETVIKIACQMQMTPP